MIVLNLYADAPAAILAFIPHLDTLKLMLRLNDSLLAQRLSDTQLPTSTEHLISITDLVDAAMMTDLVKIYCNNAIALERTLAVVGFEVQKLSGMPPHSHQ